MSVFSQISFYKHRYICKLGGLFTQVVIIKHGGAAASDGHIMRDQEGEWNWRGGGELPWS